MENKGARDFPKETLFTSFENQRKSQLKEIGGEAMLRHGAKQQLKSLLKYSKKSVIAFMKTLSPSGVELSQTKSHLHVSFHK